MVTLSQVMFALSAQDNSVRENASRMLVDEFARSPSTLQVNHLYNIILRLNDSSELVRRNLGRFIFLYVKSGRELGRLWITLSKYLGSRDVNIKTYVVQALANLGKDEHYLKAVLDDPRYSQEARMRVAEALAHFYDKKGYLSSLSDLLKRDFYTIRGTLLGIYFDRQLRIVDPKQLMPIEPVISRAMDVVSGKARKPEPRVLERQRPREPRPYARA